MENAMKDIAVIVARFNAHEQSCNDRMEEVRETFKEVKDMNKATHALVLSLLVTIACGGVATLVAVVLSKLGLG